MAAACLHKSPLSVIKSLYDESPEILHKLEDIGNYFRTILDNDFSQIPCINNVSVENIKPNSLVQYKGMIQDMFDPEFYLGKYEVVNKTKNEKEERLGCYTDTHGLADEEIDFNSDKNVTLERQTYYCVPVPGENEWIKNMYSNKIKEMEKTLMSGSVNKRSLEHDCEDDAPMDQDPTHAEQKELVSGKKLKEAECTEKLGLTNTNYLSSSSSSKNTNKADFVKNFPLPCENENEPPCFIKMYSNSNELKLNDVVDFICILSVDPIFASSSMSNENNEEMIAWPDHNTVEDQAHCPPPSLVPRLHCLFFNKVESLNPLMLSRGPIYDNVSSELSKIRSSLIQLLTQNLGGDATVAEYILFYLISSVYGRCGTMCVGKLTMNIMKCPSGEFTENLYKFIEMLVEKSHYLPLKLENLNNLKFIPRKDYDANRLVTGVLQLPSGLHMVLDETKMESGKLDSDGVHNLTAIGNVMQWQKVEYDFKFNKVDIDTNLNVLVMSEGKSILTCDCQLPIVSDDLNADQVERVISSLAPKLLEKIRLYLSIVSSMEYNLTDEIQKALEDDFVEMRKDDSKSINADSFYLLLTTARYMALSYGQSTLSSSLWIRTKELDAERRKRIS